ncbi:MAG: hypothetical protein CMD33_09805 [Flavobacteriales bacterium]|nr:hypothetical protein [Flavobacteriales bacterium]
MFFNNTSPAKVDPSGFNASGIDHERIQRFIIVVLGVLTFAVFATSCTTQKSCSAYQQVELAE